MRGHGGYERSCPPILSKDGPQDFFKLEEKMAGYRISKNISEKCLKTRLKKSLSWKDMKNDKTLILGHIYVAKLKNGFCRRATLLK